MDSLDLLAVQGTLKNLPQHHSSKASILQHLAFFTVQLSYPYMITGKTIALTRWTFVGKVISLLLNMLSRLVITFLPRSKRLLISWLLSPSAVILEPPKNKVWHCFPIYLPWSDRTGCHDLHLLSFTVFNLEITYKFRVKVNVPNIFNIQCNQQPDISGNRIVLLSWDWYLTYFYYLHGYILGILLPRSAVTSIFQSVPHVNYDYLLRLLITNDTSFLAILESPRTSISWFNWESILPAALPSHIPSYFPPPCPTEIHHYAYF